jgi:hypothetical protein
MWNRLKGSGRRGIALGIVAAAAVIVAVVLLVGSEDEQSTSAPVATAVAPDSSEPAPEQKKRKGSDEAKSPRPDEDPEPAPGAVEPGVLEEFQDCVRAHGGRPIDLTAPSEQEDEDPAAEGAGEDDDVPPALAGYTPEEIEALREARAACIEELPPEIREQAEQQAQNLEDSPFRACVVEEQAAGSEIAEAVQACEGEIPGG